MLQLRFGEAEEVRLTLLPYSSEGIPAPEPIKYRWKECEALFHWKALGHEDATWEPIEELWAPFPELNLEDIVYFEGGRDDGNPITKVYVRSSSSGKLKLRD